MFVGVALGLVAGYVGGVVDGVIMRVADVQISFPAILIALLIDGVMRALLPGGRHEELVFYVLVLSIGFHNGCNSLERSEAQPWWSATRNTCRQPV
ncbi:MAG: hypothetical protein Ct9H300mP13_2310 [Gammaproteobacteria bacterium]|nr:MAG: hypothetical protein Ct9H300mP13_2310 [Gammaproteobacteria bacterium]